jgi:hypothetical protein
MGGYKKIEPRWKKGESGNPKGRPVSLQTKLKEYFYSDNNLKLSKSQTQQIINAIIGKNRQELQILAKDEALPFWVAMLAQKAQKDFQKGSIELVELLWNRLYGTPNQNIQEETTQTIRQFVIKTNGNKD